MKTIIVVLTFVMASIQAIVGIFLYRGAYSYGYNLGKLNRWGRQCLAKYKNRTMFYSKNFRKKRQYTDSAAEVNPSILYKAKRRHGMSPLRKVSDLSEWTHLLYIKLRAQTSTDGLFSISSIIKGTAAYPIETIA